MAGDWIKMRNNLWDDPRVSSLCDLTDSSEAAIVGGLYWLWASADEHTEDGHMPGLTTTGIDRKTGIKGFGAALIQVGWVEDSDGGVTILHFEEHNGTSAKRRCTDAQRKATGRTLSASEADTTQTNDGQKVEECGAREEKRREEKNKEEKSKTTPSAAPKYSARDDLVAQGVDPQIADDWLSVRKAKKAASTKTAIDGVLREISKAKMTPDAGLRMCCERGWAGFDPSWLPNAQARASPQQVKQDKAQALIDRISGNQNARNNIIDIN